MYNTLSKITLKNQFKGFVIYHRKFRHEEYNKETKITKRSYCYSVEVIFNHKVISNFILKNKKELDEYIASLDIYEKEV